MPFTKIAHEMLNEGAIKKSVNDPNATTNHVNGVGTVWLNTTTGEMFVCTDATTDANVWSNSGEGAGDIIPNPYIVATGGVEVTSGDYKIHTFNTSNPFTVTHAGSQALIEYLVLGGGGGGGSIYGGGGGAGGYLASNGLVPTEQTYSVTVGAGGAGNNGFDHGYDGTDTVFSSLTAVGGGGGGGYSGNVSAREGGSGGGGAGARREVSGGDDAYPVNNRLGGHSYSSGSQGNDGGDWDYFDNSHPGPSANQAHARANDTGTSGVGRGAGGGGAGGVGQNTHGGGGYSWGGDGGAGVYNSISGSNLAYAGGGAGGAHLGQGGDSQNDLYVGPGRVSIGGSGVGGDGAHLINSSIATNGVVNRGSGGGGAQHVPTNAGAGSSGIVILKYKFQ